MSPIAFTRKQNYEPKNGSWMTADCKLTAAKSGWERQLSEPSKLTERVNENPTAPQLAFRTATR
jgi:hypothetical protein